MNADLYTDNCNIQLKGAVICLEKYGSKINWKKNNNRIIDVGTGEGTVITTLKKYFPKNVSITGCDIDVRMLELANQNYRDEQTTFIVLDIAGELPHGMRGNYSHAFSFYCLNWVNDQESAFKNIYNLLEPNGECFLVIVSYSPIFDVYRSLTRSNKWSTWVYDIERYFSRYSDSTEPESEVKLLMEDTGFDDIDVVQEHLFYTKDDIKDLKGTMLALCPFKIPSEKVDEFWEDYLQALRLAIECEDSKKNVIFHVKVLVVHAHKPEHVIDPCQ